MRFNTLFFLLSLTCLCLALAQVSYEDCCMKYVKKNHLRKHVVKYRRQETDGGCNIPAIIFIMKRGRVFCGDPKASWVQDLMKKIDNMGTRKPGNQEKPKGQQFQHSKRG